MGECDSDSDSHSCSSSCSSLSSDCPPVYVEGRVMAPLYEAYRVSICSLRGVFEMLYEEGGWGSVTVCVWGVCVGGGGGCY